MASKIRVLNEITINQIAAGEVIENPASVVKELVENALDAGSSHICVEIRGGGRQLIRVSDNGCGMSSDDALLCLERHATSKIHNVDDLQALLTMGFRGEAIPSIASISKFMLLTCPQPEAGQIKPSQGTMVLMDGGRLISHQSAVREPGTTIEVKSLFFNVPVRKKFQKSPAYDTQEILKMLMSIALGHVDVQFELISDQKSLLTLPLAAPTLSFHEKLNLRIEALLGREFAEDLCPLKFHKDPYRLEGYIGLPTTHRPNRTGQFLFINHRIVQSPLIAFAIREGYGPSLPANRFPVFVLHLHLDGALVDVNVHPQKKEVRLRQDHILKENLIQAVQAALQAYHFTPSSSSTIASLHETGFNPPYFSTFNESKPDQQDLLPPSAPVLMSQPYLSLNTGIATKAWTPPPQQDTSEPWAFFHTPAAPTQIPPVILATLPGLILVDPISIQSYSLANWREGLCLIDQRAAHARIHYERFLAHLKTQPKQAMAIQPLLIPLTLDFSLLDAQLLQEHLSLLNRLGFDIQHFGDQTFIIHAIPEVFKNEEIQICLSTILHDLNEHSLSSYIEQEQDKQLALSACRAALSRRQRLNREEAQLLVNQLLACDSPLRCPFGKPTLVFTSSDDLMQHFEA